MKATEIEVLDSRNNMNFGYAYISWSMYMRSMDDKQLYKTQ